MTFKASSVSVLRGNATPYVASVWDECRTSRSLGYRTPLGPDNWLRRCDLVISVQGLFKYFLEMPHFHFSTDILFDSFCHLPRTSLDGTHISTRQFHAVTAQLHDRCLRPITTISLTTERQNGHLECDAFSIRFSSEKPYRPQRSSTYLHRRARGSDDDARCGDQVRKYPFTAHQRLPDRFEMAERFQSSFAHSGNVVVKKLLLERTILYDLSAAEFNQFVFR